MSGYPGYLTTYELSCFIATPITTIKSWRHNGNNGPEYVEFHKLGTGKVVLYSYKAIREWLDNSPEFKAKASYERLRYRVKPKDAAAFDERQRVLRERKAQREKQGK